MKVLFLESRCRDRLLGCDKHGFCYKHRAKFWKRMIRRNCKKTCGHCRKYNLCSFISHICLIYNAERKRTRCKSAAFLILKNQIHNGEHNLSSICKQFAILPLTIIIYNIKPVTIQRIIPYFLNRCPITTSMRQFWVRLLLGLHHNCPWSWGSGMHQVWR